MVKVPSVLVPGLLCFFIGGNSLAQTISWYKCLTGTIDKYPIIMHLHKAGHQYSGYYYYKSRQEPVGLSGEDSSERGRIKLIADISEDKKENFNFTIKGNQATGQWHSGGKSLAFSANEDSAALQFDYVYTTGTILLRPKIKDSPGANFEAMAVWPKESSKTANFLKKIINKELGFENSVVDAGKNLVSMKKQFFADYLEENKDVADKDLKEAYYLSHEENTKMEIVYQSSKLLMLATYSYAYTGGAHPNHSSSYVPVDLLNNKKLDINDILTKTGYNKLSKLLEASFRKQYEVKDTDPLTEAGLFENKIEPNNNFYVTPKGIWFYYNPYEIGPYVMGDIVILIPLTELNDYLQPEFKKLIQ